MLIIPITGKLSWKNPPWLTLFLILINCFVFFAFQGEDDARYEEAFSFYIESGLARMEVDRYRENKGALPPLPEGISEADLEEEDLLFLRAMQMHEDTDFMARLEAGQVIRPGDPDHARWRRNRDEFNGLMESVTSVAYGYRPAIRRPVTLLTYQFLHGGLAHLIGNMIFLWLFGCMLEMGLGRLQFLVIYLASGVAACLLFGAFNLQSTTPLVGASGAIAGLMGALTTTYGRSKVTFFFTSGFFFSNLRLPAIALLPFWLGKEIYSELSAGGMSNVAFMAHAGGIVAGAFLGWLADRLKLMGDASAFEAPPKDEITPRLEAALDHMGALRFDAARTLLQEILELSPGHPDAVGYLFNIEKSRPQEPAFHAAAAAYMEQLTRHQTSFEKAHTVYTEYIQLVKPPKLSPELYTRLSMAFSDAGHPQTAGQILSALLKKAPHLNGLPTALLKLAGAYQRAGQTDQASRCRRLLCKRFPQSSEAQIAGRLLESIGSA